MKKQKILIKLSAVSTLLLGISACNSGTMGASRHTIIKTEAVVKEVASSPVSNQTAAKSIEAPLNQNDNKVIPEGSFRRECVNIRRDSVTGIIVARCGVKKHFISIDYNRKCKPNSNLDIELKDYYPNSTSFPSLVYKNVIGFTCEANSNYSAKNHYNPRIKSDENYDHSPTFYIGNPFISNDWHDGVIGFRDQWYKKRTYKYDFYTPIGHPRTISGDFSGTIWLSVFDPHSGILDHVNFSTANFGLPYYENGKYSIILSYTVAYYPNFNGANMPGLNMEGLEIGKLEYPSFRYANLEKSNFAINKTYLDHTALIHPDFTGADLTEADFSGAVVVGGDFTDAIVDGVNFENALMSGSRMPDGTVMPEGKRCAVGSIGRCL